MAEKTTYKDKLKGLLEAKSLAILGLIIMSSWNFFSDTFKEGADSKFSNKVVTVVTVDHRVGNYLDSLFEAKIKEAMNNPLIWFDALSSDFVGAFADKKATEVRSEVESKLIEMDSIQKSFIRQLGEGWGIRDDKVVDLFIDLGKKFIDGRLGVRTVSATF